MFTTDPLNSISWRPEKLSKSPINTSALSEAPSAMWSELVDIKTWKQDWITEGMMGLKKWTTTKRTLTAPSKALNLYHFVSYKRAWTFFENIAAKDPKQMQWHELIDIRNDPSERCLVKVNYDLEIMASEYEWPITNEEWLDTVVYRTFVMGLLDVLNTKSSPVVFSISSIDIWEACGDGKLSAHVIIWQHCVNNEHENQVRRMWLLHQLKKKIGDNWDKYHFSELTKDVNAKGSFRLPYQYTVDGKRPLNYYDGRSRTIDGTFNLERFKRGVIRYVTASWDKPILMSTLESDYFSSSLSLSNSLGFGACNGGGSSSRSSTDQPQKKQKTDSRAFETENVYLEDDDLAYYRKVAKDYIVALMKPEHLKQFKHLKLDQIEISRSATRMLGSGTLNIMISKVPCPVKYEYYHKAEPDHQPTHWYHVDTPIREVMSMHVSFCGSTPLRCWMRCHHPDCGPRYTEIKDRIFRMSLY